MASYRLYHSRSLQSSCLAGQQRARSRSSQKP